MEKKQAPRSWPTFSIKTLFWHLAIWLALLGFRLTIDYPSEREARLPGTNNLEILGQVVALAVWMETLRAFFPTGKSLAIAVAVLLAITVACAVMLALVFWDGDAAIYALIPLLLIRSEYMWVEWPLLIFLLTRRWDANPPQQCFDRPLPITDGFF